MIYYSKLLCGSELLWCIHRMVRTAGVDCCMYCIAQGGVLVPMTHELTAPCTPYTIMLLPVPAGQVLVRTIRATTTTAATPAGYRCRFSAVQGWAARTYGVCGMYVRVLWSGGAQCSFTGRGGKKIQYQVPPASTAVVRCIYHHALYLRITKYSSK